MVKLTPDLILCASQRTNPVTRDRELDLRGYKIPLVENLGATLDQFDAIDFSDNEVRKLDNFPFLPRLKTLYVNNNRVCRFGDNLADSLPNVDTLVLTNNNVADLADVETAAKGLNKVQSLSLLSNPVTAKPNYRLFTIHKFPRLRVLDFKKVKQKERDEAKALFKTKAGKEQLKEIKKRAKTFVPGEELDKGGRPATNASGLTAEQVRNIKAAIARATTLDEIERLNQMLRTGHIPNEEAK